MDRLRAFRWLIAAAFALASVAVGVARAGGAAGPPPGLSDYFVLKAGDQVAWDGDHYFWISSTLSDPFAVAASGSLGTAIYGYASASHGATVGVWGDVASDDGYGGVFTGGGGIYTTGLTLDDGTAVAGYVLTCNADGVATWQPPAGGSGGGDITAVYAGPGLGGGGETGAVTLSLHSSYIDGSAYDSRFVNEGQADAITSAMILDGTLTDGDIAALAAIAPSKIAGIAWTALNDGAGSGLDADLLDGLDSTAFALAGHNHDGRYFTETELSTSGGGGQVHWDNLLGVPAGLADGDQDTTYTVGTGLSLVGTELSLDTAYTDAQYVNEGQADAVSTDMLQDDAVTLSKIAPNVLSSLSGVSNDGGDIALLAGDGITITPDGLAKTITIAATGGGADADWTIAGNDMCSAVSGNVGIGTTTPSEKLDVVGNIRASGTIESGGTISLDGEDRRISVTQNPEESGSELELVMDGSTFLQFNYRNSDENWFVIRTRQFYCYDMTVDDISCSSVDASSIAASGGTSTEWTTAYGWGDHSTAGYLTAESDPSVNMTTTNAVPKWDGPALIDGTIFDNGNIGIGTATPAQKLDVVGTAQMTGFKMPMGAGAGKVLTSDGSGVGTWQPAAGGADADWTIDGDDMYTAVSGNVGIGTASPQARLDVRGMHADDGATVDIGNSDASRRLRLFGGRAGDPDPFMMWRAGGALRFATDPGGEGWAEHARITDTGCVGIGLTDPTHKIHITGGAYCDGGAWVDGSSRQSKQDIRGLDAKDAIDALGRLEPTRFYYKQNPDEECLGFIAEDVPNLVATKDRKGVAPMDIVAVLTKVVQQQQKEIEELKKQLAERQ